MNIYFVYVYEYIPKVSLLVVFLIQFSSKLSSENVYMLKYITDGGDRT